ncbi:MAG: hypothetical protein AA908_09570 [Chlorobi bacterium NICIL-2]|nr:MAG: hypothetical protein AA908_09570 [Chlorobi bacterium NICIL-2]
MTGFRPAGKPIGSSSGRIRKHLLTFRQFVDGFGQGRREMFEEPVGFGHMESPEPFFVFPEGDGEFAVAGGHLVQAFEVGVQKVGGLDIAVQFGIIGRALEKRFVGRLELIRHGGEQPFRGDRFDFPEIGQDAGIVMLHGRRDVAGEHFRRVVKQRIGRRPGGIDVAAEDFFGDAAQKMRQDGHLIRVFRHVFGRGASHERPALDVFQPVQVSQKMMPHGPLLFSEPVLARFMSSMLL